jgi:hypothetical protein
VVVSYLGVLSMKKTSILLLLVFLRISAFPQVQTGLKFGYILLKCFDQSINGPNEYTNPHPSYFISFMLRGRNPGWFNMGGELEYAHRFFHVNSTSGGVSGQTFESYDLSADNIRVLIQPQFTFGTGIRFFIYPGFYGGYIFHSTIHGTSEYQGSGYPEPKKYIDGSASDYIHGWEFGILIGLGIDIPLYKGLTLVLENTETLTIPGINPNWGARTTLRILEIRFSAGIAYTFPAKKIPK